MNLIQAVRSLRQHLGESQQIFATRLGLSIRALSNYEKDRIPSSRALGSLINEAVKADREDLAKIFRQAYWQAHARTFPGLTDEESAWAEVLCDVLQNRNTPTGRQAWEMVRKSLCQAVDSIAEQAVRTQDPDAAEATEAARGHVLIAVAASRASTLRTGKEESK